MQQKFMAEVLGAVVIVDPSLAKASEGAVWGVGVMVLCEGENGVFS